MTDMSYCADGLEKKSMEAADEPTMPVISSVSESTHPGFATPTGTLTPKDELDISEIIPHQKAMSLDKESLPDSPRSSKQERLYELLSYSTTLGILFMQGWNDGTTGPLLPTMQSHYKVSTLRSSLRKIFHQDIDRLYRRINDFRAE